MLFVLQVLYGMCISLILLFFAAISDYLQSVTDTTLKVAGLLAVSCFSRVSKLVTPYKLLL